MNNPRDNLTLSFRFVAYGQLLQANVIGAHSYSTHISNRQFLDTNSLAPPLEKLQTKFFCLYSARFTSLLLTNNPTLPIGHPYPLTIGGPNGYLHPPPKSILDSHSPDHHPNEVQSNENRRAPSQQLQQVDPQPLFAADITLIATQL